MPPAADEENYRPVGAHGDYLVTVFMERCEAIIPQCWRICVRTGPTEYHVAGKAEASKADLTDQHGEGGRNIPMVCNMHSLGIASGERYEALLL